MRTSDFQLLNTAVALTAEERCWPHIDAFVESYEGRLENYGLKVSGELRILVSDDSIEPPDVFGQAVHIHRSKHKYWNLCGWRDLTQPGRFVWPTRSLELRVSEDHSEVQIFPFIRAEFGQIGEAAFHVARSVAIYSRGIEDHMLVHGSAVGTPYGAIIFVGPSGTGKTTFLLAGVAHRACFPISNDRVYIRCNDTPHVFTWPSYISVCERTISAWAPLERAAREVAERPADYMTLHWPKEIAATLQLGRKRIYPPQWLTDATTKKFAATAPLVAICLLNSRTIAPVRQLSFCLNRDVAALREALLVNSFDTAEPAFLPWHEMSLPPQNSARVIERFLLSAKAAGLNVFTINPVAFPAHYFDSHVQLLDEIIRRST
jgi:hypothetical protein